ncbi:DUF1799 domain-containing protein [Mycoplana ramosa]|uniref:DUF1799 domain-containing protein n=1 Tax=Mycoplana ramosa TaxID=40837 RepID=A0ABW3Z248_MYCRA
MGVRISQPSNSGDVLEIMPTNWRSLMAFLECQTQWRVAAGMAGLIWLGLDYSACKLVLDSLGAPAGIFADLRFLETCALPILNEVDA